MEVKAWTTLHQGRNKQKLSIVKASIFQYEPIAKNNPSLENATRFNCIQFQIFHVLRKR